MRGDKYTSKTSHACHGHPARCPGRPPKYWLFYVFPRQVSKEPGGADDHASKRAENHRRKDVDQRDDRDLDCGGKSDGFVLGGECHHDQHRNGDGLPYAISGQDQPTYNGQGPGNEEADPEGKRLISRNRAWIVKKPCHYSLETSPKR